VNLVATLQSIKPFIPQPLLRVLRRFRVTRAQALFKTQGTTTLRCGAFDLEAPQSHRLLQWLAVQPYRDLFVGITAKYAAGKYPSGTFVDIGANIGDTAAVIATYAPQSNLILVEASDYFLDFLKRNAKRLPNPIDIKHALVSDGTPTRGELIHWGGTAHFEVANTPPIPTFRLSEVAGTSAALIKIDTDGFDAQIINSALDFLAALRPVLIFESQIRTRGDLEIANTLVGNLKAIGYSHFIIWDGCGWHMLSTSDTCAVDDLQRYLLQSPIASICSNYDIACFAGRDMDIFDLVTQCYRSGELSPK
jgi:FkbM family methyltransferase